MKTPAYKRVLIKVSGEALAGGKSTGLDFAFIDEVCKAVKQCVDMGAQIAIVVGGGNFWRRLKNGEGHMERSRADHMGMLATVMNALAVSDRTEQQGMSVKVMTSVAMTTFADVYTRRDAVKALENGTVVIFGGGTGNPYFSTDSAAALKASEIGADALLKATKVDGIYTADPKKDPKAKKYSTLKYETALEKRLKVMDSAAFALCMDNEIPIVVFDFFDGDALERVVKGEAVGTIVS
jgi:uridylate kinase